MTSSPLHFAKRETQALVRRPKLWVGLLAAGIVLGIAGPFGTEEAMRVLPRIIYWSAIATITFLTGSLIALAIERAFAASKLSPWAISTLAGFAIGIVVALEIILLNWATFGLSLRAPGYAAPLAMNAIVVSIVISLAARFIAPEPASKPQAAPRLLDRLPFEKRGRLVALSVSDHYVDVITTKGQELLLMRLSDAILETAPEAGLQVHRSHWVALSAVETARRDGARAILTLSNGTEIPVSRTYLPTVKDAGLLPG